MGTKRSQHDFRLASQGVRDVEVWEGTHVVVIIEISRNFEEIRAMSVSEKVRQCIVNAFDIVYIAMRDVTDFEPDLSVDKSGKLVIEIPFDNAGAGGLACHGVAGISVGRPLFLQLVQRWTSAVSSTPDCSWLPSVPSPPTPLSVEALEYGQCKPNNASLDQVYYYELCRNFWHPSRNRKIDWACDNNPQCWGWWTVGFNNAFAIIFPSLLNSPLHYFGRDLRQFRHSMVKQLYKYIEYCQNHDDPFVAWTCSRLPWDPSESVNDLMTALIVLSFETFGRLSWIRALFRAFDIVPDVNPTEAGGFRFQQCRDNIYKIWCIAAQTDLEVFFCEQLRWRISPEAIEYVLKLFPGSDPVVLPFSEFHDCSWRLKRCCQDITLYDFGQLTARIVSWSDTIWNWMARRTVLGSKTVLTLCF